MIAHGDHVFLARQSSKVSVQDQHERPAAMLLEAPPTPFVIDEDDGRDHVALADHAVGGHERFRRASSTSRRNVGCAFMLHLAR